MKLFNRYIKNWWFRKKDIDNKEIVISILSAADLYKRKIISKNQLKEDLENILRNFKRGK